MDSGINKIKELLEEEYDIPFIVDTSYEGREPCYYISPDNPGKELFSIKVSFQNKVRLIMEYIPQTYGANFIHGMGEQPNEAKMRFVSYISLMRSKGAKCAVKVNGNSLDTNAPGEWPSFWNSFEARVTKMPVSIDSYGDYYEHAKTWGSLMVGMVLSLANIVPIESDDPVSGFAEGEVKYIQTKRYERNPLNRKLCLEVHGYQCKICGFDFEKTYGEIGYHFIHVHHIVPVAKMGGAYIIDPVKDLIPVCPNCHAMLHSIDPPFTPEQLKEKIVI